MPDNAESEARRTSPRLNVGDRVRINFDGREATVTEVHPPGTETNQTSSYTYTVTDDQGWSHSEYGSTVTLISEENK